MKKELENENLRKIWRAILDKLSSIHAWHIHEIGMIKYRTVYKHLMDSQFKFTWYISTKCSDNSVFIFRYSNY